MGNTNNRGSSNANQLIVTAGFGVSSLRPPFIERLCGKCCGKGFTYVRAMVDCKFGYVMSPCMFCNGHGFVMMEVD